METMGKAAPAAEAVSAARQADKRRLVLAVQQAGGAAQWLRQVAPNLADGCPPESSEVDLARETIAFYEGASSREARCVKCPKHGGACEKDGVPLPEGVRPMWIDGRLTARQCGRWPEYIVRRRLIAAGVPRAYASLKLAEYQGGDHPLNLAIEFQQYAAETDRYLVLHGTGSGHTTLAVGALRNLKRKHPRLILNYTSCAHLDRLLKSFYENKGDEPDPLEGFRLADIGVIELGDLKGMPSFMAKALRDAMSERLEQERSTMVTTFSALRELTSTFGFLRSERVQTCQLSL